MGLREELSGIISGMKTDDLFRECSEAATHIEIGNNRERLNVLLSELAFMRSTANGSGDALSDSQKIQIEGWYQQLSDLQNEQK